MNFEGKKQSETKEDVFYTYDEYTADVQNHRGLVKVNKHTGKPEIVIGIDKKADFKICCAIIKYQQKNPNVTEYPEKLYWICY